MLPHGPDVAAFERASNEPLAPKKLSDTLSFMFETRFPQHLTAYAASLSELQEDYPACWSGLPRHFPGRLPAR